MNRKAAVDAVRDYFYRGEIARKIDAFCRAHDGLLRYDDLAAFRLEVEEPQTVDYRGHKVYKSGFWSQGPVLLQILNIIEGFDLKGMQFNSAEYLHTVVEAMKLAYADRDTYYADPEYASVPGERLLSEEYAGERRNQIGKSASYEFRPGDVRRAGGASFSGRASTRSHRR